MTYKAYLTLLGAVLIAVTLLSIGHVDGPTPHDSIFGASWWFDTVENYGHGIVGVVALLIAWLGDRRVQRFFVGLAIIAGIGAAAYSAIIGEYILGAHFQHPADTLFHALIAVLAIVSLLCQRAGHSKVESS